MIVASTKNQSGKQEEIRDLETEIAVLEMQIAVNEMLPRDMQCKGYIAKLKAQLARMRQKPSLKPVSDKNT